MTKFNTGNPVGSSDPRDLFDNASVADNLVNGENAAYNDRLGKSRKSWEGIESEFAAFIAASGYEFVGDYAAGIEITGYNQVVRDTAGEFWRVSGSTNLPYTTTGAGLPESGAFVTVGDAALRQEMAANAAGNGSDLMGHTGTADTVTEALNKRTTYRETVADMEALSPPVGTVVRLTHERRFGDFFVKAGAAPSDPLKGIYVTFANGNHGVRQYGQAVITGAATRPEWFSDINIGDGVGLATRPIYEAWRLRMPGGALELNGSSTYLIDASYGTDLGAGRRVICWADGEDSPRVIGNGCTVKLVDHDFSAGQGIMFAGGTACRAPKVSGINFDMTFVGINTSSSFYPFGGGVWFRDEATGLKTQDQLNRDVVAEDCTFKLFHPAGQYALSGAAFDGDPNNGFKVFSVFMSGDNQATSFDNQNQNATIKDCTLKKGHNGYGFWIWAYNNALWENPKAEDYVAKFSTSVGGYSGGGVGFIRYHQFYCKGAYVKNIMFRAKPCSERTTAGFEGSGNAVSFTTNLNAAGLDGGPMELMGGYIQAGNGDAANNQGDDVVFCNAYGALKIGGGLHFDGIDDATNAQGGSAILYSSEANGGTGYGELHIDLTFGKNSGRYNNIVFQNGAAAAADRRCKLLTIAGSSCAQNQYFLDTDGNSGQSFKGAESIVFGRVFVDGANSLFGPASTNSRAFRLNSAAGDRIFGNNVTVQNKYYEFLTSGINADTLFRISEYQSEGTTSRVLGTRAPVLTLDVTGTPEGAEVAAIGSTARRADGGTGTSFYVKEAGAGNTGWVGK